MTLTAFLTVAVLHLMVAISPGPAVLMSARTGITEGLRTGTFLAMGIGVGGVVWAGAALFGLNLVFQAAPAVLWTLKIVGGLYLIYLAWTLWRSQAGQLEISNSKLAKAKEDLTKTQNELTGKKTQTQKEIHAIQKEIDTILNSC